MLIGLISDTHIPDHAKELPEQLKEAFSGVDMIFHAGDIYSLSVLNELETIAPLLAAQGDDDTSNAVSDSRVKPKHIIGIDGVTIWLMHERPKKLPRVSREISWLDDPPDIIVFGHTHKPLVEEHQGVLHVNPGSPTFPRYKLELGTVGLLKIDSGKFEAKIIQLQ
ncbi:metallophosphoesterase family protein [Chloroflexota bacterium]